MLRKMTEPQNIYEADGFLSDMKKRVKPYWFAIILIFVIIVLLNLLACIRAFCDFYADKIYGAVSDILGIIMDVFPFAIGEILMYLFVILVILAIVFAILFLFLRKKEKYKRFTLKYMKGMLLLLLCVILIYTLNWVIPFRSSILSDKRLGRKSYIRSYSIEELQILRNYIVEKLNETSEIVERDKNGYLIYKDYGVIEDEIETSMKSLADDYPRLKGYYPSMKKAICSSALEWMNIGGYNYPYTMEATYNEYVTRLFYPSLYAHEISHHHGYFQENEANFLSYLGCINSDDAFVRYSGYIDAFYYVDDAYFEALSSAMSDEEAWNIYKKQPMVKQQVYNDEVEASKEADERYEEDSHPMEKLQAAAKKTAEKGWETQEELLQENYYEDVVGLLLYYYDGELY